MSDLKSGVAAAVLAVMGSAVAAIGAETCHADRPGYDLTAREAQAVYDCIADSLQAGYESGDTRWIPADYVAGYRAWTKASTHPAAPGFHTNRFLLTWVNDVGAEVYLQYAEDPVIPPGTVIAKESFSVDDDGAVRPGPLFLMEKTAAGQAPETGDWYYMAISAAGAPMAVNVRAACHECHSGFAHQGMLGYPVEEARVPR
ncbi:MAG: cytochrome P460 family protein [Rhodobacteraceae bacterium]|nr:cytochrome P460 family protein [Paracoccaceae bacterium]